ncbi:MAG: nucleotidyltransferase [Nitrospirae bacterium RIFCSPLOW2_12_42_9]|nr:MAG: nucleotidyltransferase [Nitrospirae bacterium RIFCSPHIGHO2_02_FULL_42_12]OGW57382.1 MAG: nucleotidyltransferase [Nitrospirae bacterium RIFCSPLOW2_12_42_9]HBI24135.1 nucleotidyltransferase [Nitrospiraceae bacterium]HKZ56394.1 nucleotidyltransferase family protein [Thermodesulfovibrionales bacterium]
MRSQKTKEEIISTLNSFLEIIRKEYKAEVVGLFGSYARGELRETSDVDIIVRFLDDASLFDLVGLADFLEEKLGIKVDIVPIDTIRKEIKEDVLREAVYL